MATPKKDQVTARRIHMVWSPTQSPATAMAKGMRVLAKPRKSVGGWMTIQ